jgi:hypothetical protein
MAAPSKVKVLRPLQTAAVALLMKTKASQGR